MSWVSELRRRGERTARRTNASPWPPGAALGSPLVSSGLFEDASNFDLRFIESYEQIETIVNALKTLGLKVVLTSGS
ncbi:MAG TPA: hypothetical protein VGH56_11180, partial [Solirubrobacteraceae bacterium]